MIVPSRVCEMIASVDELMIAASLPRKRPMTSCAVEERFSCGFRLMKSWPEFGDGLEPPGPVKPLQPAFLPRRLCPPDVMVPVQLGPFAAAFLARIVLMRVDGPAT